MQRRPIGDEHCIPRLSVKRYRHIDRGIVDRSNYRFEICSLIAKPFVRNAKALWMVADRAVLNETSPPYIGRAFVRHDGFSFRKERVRLRVLAVSRPETFKKIWKVGDTLLSELRRAWIFLFALHRGADRGRGRYIAIGMEVASTGGVRKLMGPGRHAEAFDDLTWLIGIEGSSECAADDEQGGPLVRVESAHNDISDSIHRRGDKITEREPARILLQGCRDIACQGGHLSSSERTERSSDCVDVPPETWIERCFRKASIRHQ